MSVATVNPERAADTSSFELQRRRWTIAEFEELIRTGAIREGGPEFLWDGDIIRPMSENEPHVNAYNMLIQMLYERLPMSDWLIRANNPLTLREGYLPNPDLVVLPGPRSRYGARRPTASETSLVVEIANTSYVVDSQLMLPEYARAGVVQYWIVHIPARRVEVYRNPQIVDDVGVYDPPTLFELDASVPLSLRPGPNLAEVRFEPIPVRVLLCDSLETNP